MTPLHHAFRQIKKVIGLVCLATHILTGIIRAKFAQTWLKIPRIHISHWPSTCLKSLRFSSEKDPPD